MAESINDLKAKAYDLGKQLGVLQEQANIIVEKIKAINIEINKGEKN